MDAARAEGADYVILLAHLGVDASSAPWLSTDVIAHTEGVDAVLDGHSHTVMECERVRDKTGKRVLLSQMGTKLSNIGMLVLSKEGNLSTGLLSAWEGTDAETQAVVDKAEAALEEQISVKVAQSDVDLWITDSATGVRLVRNAETNLGDLCADAYRAVTGADVALLNGGCIRSDLPKGDVTYGDILTVFPFNNSVCVVNATGQQILDALEMGARAVPEEVGGFLQVSGLTYEINLSVASSVRLDENGMFASVDGPYRVQNVQVGGKSLDLEKTYTVASHDYLLKAGGDGLNMFQQDTLAADNVTVDHQLLVQYLQQNLGGKVGAGYEDPYGDGRIVAVETQAAS